jgi:hypothetical protein
MKTNHSNLKYSAVLFLLSILFLDSCKKKEEALPQINLNGTIYHSCNTPARNMKFILLREGTSSILGSTDFYQETLETDSQGHFCHIFKKEGGSGPISIKYLEKKILQAIPVDKDLCELKAYLRTTATIQVRLNVTNPYTSLDTLKITNFTTEDILSVPGPLTSGILYTGEYTLLDNSYGGTNKTLYTYFNSNSAQRKKQEVLFNKFCNDTIFVTVPIN